METRSIWKLTEEGTVKVNSFIKQLYAKKEEAEKNQTDTTEFTNIINCDSLEKYGLQYNASKDGMYQDEFYCSDNMKMPICLKEGTDYTAVKTAWFVSVDGEIGDSSKWSEGKLVYDGKAYYVSAYQDDSCNENNELRVLEEALETSDAPTDFSEIYDKDTDTDELIDQLWETFKDLYAKLCEHQGKHTAEYHLYDDCEIEYMVDGEIVESRDV